jgi:uncharacterized protein YlxW (UPF0749 family)
MMADHLIQDVDRLCQKALIASGTPVETLPTDERKIMQRRIKNQRRELRRLNANLRGLDMLVRSYSTKLGDERRNGYQHAASIADTFWCGKRIAAAIRRWC